MVKNSYDADAIEVTLTFINSINIGGRLIISDDGEGMNKDQLINGFMRISSTDKIQNPYSEIYQRKRAGQKGIGRFAVQRLGDKLTIITQTENGKDALKLIIDWDKYSNNNELHNITNILETSTKKRLKGTTLIIDGLRDKWTEAAIKRIYRYVGDILQPFPLSKLIKEEPMKLEEESIVDPGFKPVFYISPDGKLRRRVGDEKLMVYNHATAIIDGSIDSEGYGTFSIDSQKLDFSFQDKIGINPDDNQAKFTKLKTVNFRAYYYIYSNNLIPKTQETAIKKLANISGGIRLYRNGFRVLPYGLTNAVDNLGKLNETLNYDKNGNINNLVRLGHIVGGTTIPDINNPLHFGTMDNLVYTYETNSNKLTIVSDTGNDTFGFKDDQIGTGADTTIDYTYDVNGNMKTDTNKGITNITYNYLNLPVQISMTSGTISYIYDATGVKQRKIVSTGATTDYAGNYVYENGNLQFFNTAEGYVEPKNTANYGSGFNYVYQYKDHLGNIRLSYKDISLTSTPSLQIQEENNYYPFGLLHKGYNSQINGVVNNYKQYQDQEFTEDLGLNVHEWKYRFSDPAIGRFWSIDPLADDYRYQSPYNFSENRVIEGVELEGLEYVSVHHIMNGNTHIRTTSTDYYRMTDKEINDRNGTPAGAYNAASYGSEGKGVKHIYHDIQNNSISERWDNRRVDFASSAGNHGLYSGAGSITKYGGSKDYNFNYQPVDWSDAIAKRHDKDYEDATKSGGAYAGYIDDTRTYQADVDMLGRLDTFMNGGQVNGVDTPYRTTTSGEMELSVKGQKTVIGALAAYKKWKIDKGYSNKQSFKTLGQEFYKTDKLNAIIIGLIYDNKEN